MKKIAFLTILIFIIGIMFSCNDSSSGDDVAVGYIDPALGTPKVINANKAYTLTGFTASPCSGSACLSIIYQGEISGVPYVGIAVKDSDGNPNIKIYWQASSIPVGTTLSIPNCTVSYNGTPNIQTLSVDIIDNTSTTGTYKIIFNGAVTGTGIVNTNSIDAVKI